MPVELDLPKGWRSKGWKVKIRDRRTRLRLRVTTMETEAVMISKERRVESRHSRFRPRYVWTTGAIQRVLVERAQRPNLWILRYRKHLPRLMKAIKWSDTHNLGDLIIWDNVQSEQLAALSSVFKRIAFAPPKGSHLPFNQLVEVLTSDENRDLVISGVVDERAGTLTIWRGDSSKLVVPLTAFPTSASKPRPNFGNFSITDHGQTLKFGGYEASVDSVLYDFDPEYRRRLKAKRIVEDKGFGPSLKRLRLQKKIRRKDFYPLSEKTIARIERGKVHRIHPRTKIILARTLGVKASEIESY